MEDLLLNSSFTGVYTQVLAYRAERLGKGFGARDYTQVHVFINFDLMSADTTQFSFTLTAYLTLKPLYLQVAGGT